MLMLYGVLNITCRLCGYIIQIFLRTGAQYYTKLCGIQTEAVKTTTKITDNGPICAPRTIKSLTIS